jgi:ferritin
MDIKKSMQDAFNAQIVEEMYASNLYLQMSFWFRKEGWEGFAKWMAAQSDEEKGHAMDMANFVINRGGHVELKAIPSVPTEWKDAKDVFEQAMKHEQHVSQLIYNLAEKADEEKDRTASNFCDKYVDEQMEEEKSMRDILNYFRHRDGSAVAEIDEKLGGVRV